jgi:membrane protease YdiL (CAAX protease family)
LNVQHQTSGDRFAAELRGFGPPGILAILVILLTGNIVLSNMLVLPVGSVLVLAWARLSHTAWREIGYIKPGNWIVTIVGGFAFGIAFKLLMKVIVLPLLGADPVNPAYHFLTGNKALLPMAILVMFIVGFSEETVFRGFMFERMGKIIRPGFWKKPLIILITSAWFGFSHYYTQGTYGVVQATLVGLVFGTIYAYTGKIWLLIFAHTAFDLTALAIIYWDLETYVAHLIFK